MDKDNIYDLIYDYDQGVRGIIIGDIISDLEHGIWTDSCGEKIKGEDMATSHLMSAYNKFSERNELGRKDFCHKFLVLRGYKCSCGCNIKISKRGKVYCKDCIQKDSI